MPTYREPIYICPDENGQPAWILDFPLWWDRGAFFKKIGEHQIDTGNLFYVDYGLLLTGGETNAWDKRCREALAGDPQPHVVEAIRRLEAILRTASWVVVKSYEWESGLY